MQARGWISSVFLWLGWIGLGAEAICCSALSVLERVWRTNDCTSQATPLLFVFQKSWVRVLPLDYIFQFLLSVIITCYCDILLGLDKMIWQSQFYYKDPRRLMMTMLAMIEGSFASPRLARTLASVIRPYTNLVLIQIQVAKCLLSTISRYFPHSCSVDLSEGLTAGTSSVI